MAPPIHHLRISINSTQLRHDRLRSWPVITAGWLKLSQKPKNIGFHAETLKSVTQKPARNPEHRVFTWLSQQPPEDEGLSTRTAPRLHLVQVAK